VALYFRQGWVRLKLDEEVTELLRQESSCENAKGASSQPYTILSKSLSNYTLSNGPEDSKVIILGLKTG
jgi:hypothetical protein